MRRVVITGIGVISPLGLGKASFWENLLSGRSGVRRIESFDPSGFPSQVAGEIPAFKFGDFVPKSYRKATKIMARDIEMAVVAADLAVKDARLITKGAAGSLTPEQMPGWFKPDPRRMGCNIGSGLICADLDELTHAMAQARNADRSGFNQSILAGLVAGAAIAAAIIALTPSSGNANSGSDDHNPAAAMTREFQQNNCASSGGTFVPGSGCY
jgi:3-oxoacyl-(acyl-carrier-protein) synthase